MGNFILISSIHQKVNIKVKCWMISNMEKESLFIMMVISFRDNFIKEKSKDIENIYLLMDKDTKGISIMDLSTERANISLIAVIYNNHFIKKVNHLAPEFTYIIKRSK